MLGDLTNSEILARRWTVGFHDFSKLIRSSVEIRLLKPPTTEKPARLNVRISMIYQFKPTVLEESSRWQNPVFDPHKTTILRSCLPGYGKGWKVPLNCGWLDVIQHDKHSLNSQEHSAEPNWNIALFCMKL
jgi:hypothetical protein